MLDNRRRTARFTREERELFERSSEHRGYSPKDDRPEPEIGPSTKGSASSSVEAGSSDDKSEEGRSEFQAGLAGQKGSSPKRLISVLDGINES